MFVKCFHVLLELVPGVDRAEGSRMGNLSISIPSCMETVATRTLLWRLSSLFLLYKVFLSVLNLFILAVHVLISR